MNTFLLKQELPYHSAGQILFVTKNQYFVAKRTMPVMRLDSVLFIVVSNPVRQMP